MMLGYDVNKIRKDFSILSKPVIYFDNACMSLKPKQVINKMNEYYNDFTACAGRSAHSFASIVDNHYLNTRNIARKFINAKQDCEIVFTKNTTEGINLVANSFSLKKGDEIIISDKEHNSNLILWLKLKKDKEINLKIVKSNSDNTFSLENFEEQITNKTKIVSIVHTSNLDGVQNPIKEIVKIAHDNSSKVMIDAAQGVPSKEIDVKKLDVDFMSFSGHKMLGPTATGILYGKKELLEELNPFIVGGETVVDSTYNDFKLDSVPHKFEAGLQDYAGVIGLGEAFNYLSKIGLKKISVHEFELNKIVSESFENNKKIELIGPKDPKLRGGIFSFNITHMNPHDVSKILDSSKKIMTRSGRHCVHSWFNKHNIFGSVRASFYLYNTKEEVNIFVDELNKIIDLN
jgi:cysteine desulfurase / selenocysteine lyase